MWSLIITCLALGLFGSEKSIVSATNCTIVAKGNSKFPKDFSFGVATSAYQIEGGWNADGKGVSIWDEYTHENPDRITDKSSGDVAIDSYHKFDLDLQALKDLKVNHYRFSIAWTRIFPYGDVLTKNQKGIDYYNSVIDKLLENGIEPLVTMYHWDLPVHIQKFGGFTNSLIIQQFLDYAEELFTLFGDRVKSWITFNEPFMICKNGYGIVSHPPLVNASGVGDYMCITNLLKAHGATYRLYKSKYYAEQKGAIGISLDTSYTFSETNNTAVVARSMEYKLGILAHPIVGKTGDYPSIILDEIKAKSEREGRKQPRLTSFGSYWKDVIHGSADFLGINYYTSRYSEQSSEPIDDNPSMDSDCGYDNTVSESWPRAKSAWLYCVPQGLEGLLKHIRDEYNNVEVRITENGWSDDGQLDDDGRIRYYRSHIQAVLNAINDGCNVTSYSAWSLFDNFEWNMGYTEKFGLYYVNMKSPKRERIAKKSAIFYKNVIETRSVPKSDNFKEYFTRKQRKY